jgi:hypothetical protein
MPGIETDWPVGGGQSAFGAEVAVEGSPRVGVSRTVGVKSAGQAVGSVISGITDVGNSVRLVKSEEGVCVGVAVCKGTLATGVSMPAETNAGMGVPSGWGTDVQPVMHTIRANAARGSCRTPLFNISAPEEVTPKSSLFP